MDKQIVLPQQQSQICFLLVNIVGYEGHNAIHS